MVRGINNNYGLERNRRKKKKKKYLIKWDEKKKIDGGKIRKMECFFEEKKIFKHVFYLF